MFALKMALRYITEQKRHSLLTVCSIASALALITMLFCSFFTVIGCARDISYGERPYHIEFHNLDSEDLQTLRDYAGDDAQLTIYEEEDGYYVRVYFTKQINRSIFADPGYIADLMKLFKTSEIEYTINSTLILLDMVDIDARGAIAVAFAEFYILVNFFIILLRLIIDAAFEISSRERERQFGVLQSVGATPGQIVKTITAEGMLLSLVGVPAGVLAGIGLAYAAYRAVAGTGFLFTPQQMEYVHFHISPLFLLIAAVTGTAWVFFSAYGTGMRVIKTPPVQAISGRGNTVKKVRRHSFFGALFGWKGKTASRNNFRQPKRFAITVLSLTLSIVFFAGLTPMVNLINTAVNDIWSYDNDGYYQVDTEKGSDFYLWSYGSHADDSKAIEDSGYFKNISMSAANYYYIRNETELLGNVFITYMNEYEYNKYFNGTPPMAYSELAESCGFVLCIPEKDFTFGEGVNEFMADNIVNYETLTTRVVSKEEYESVPEEERAEKDYYTVSWDAENPYRKNELINAQAEIVTEYTFNSKEEMNYDDQYNTTVQLVGTISAYDKDNEMYETGFFEIYCDLADESYHQDALLFIDKDPSLYLMIDNYSYTRKINSIHSAVRVAALFLAAALALTAAVNLVNIISTGLLNRQSELAAMQCVGMTKGQLYGMTVLECLQYSVTAGIAASAVVLLLIKGTNAFITGMDVDSLVDDVRISLGFDYTSMLAKVWLSTLAAFAAALAASLVTLGSMEKRPLVDLIRKAE